MFTATVRGMLAHRLRLALTTASIALGVAFLAGTLILTDTMKLAFDQLFGKVSSGTDAVVRQESAYDASSGVGLSHAPIQASVLSTVKAVDELGQTVVMVTHDPTAASYADRVIFLADGHIVDELLAPSAEDVLDRMKSLGG